MRVHTVPRGAAIGPWSTEPTVDLVAEQVRSRALGQLRSEPHYHEPRGVHVRMEGGIEGDLGLPEVSAKGVSIGGEVRALQVSVGTDSCQ